MSNVLQLYNFQTDFEKNRRFYRNTIQYYYLNVFISLQFRKTIFFTNRQFVKMRIRYLYILFVQ